MSETLTHIYNVGDEVAFYRGTHRFEGRIINSAAFHDHWCVQLLNSKFMSVHKQCCNKIRKENPLDRKLELDL